MNETDQFRLECAAEIGRQSDDEEFQRLTRSWMERATALRYSYHFSALGRPIIQYPQDMVAVQELIWKVRPDLIIETGIAHGGSLILSASCLALLDYCDAVAEGGPFDPSRGKRRVIGLDIDIRDHNRAAIEAHPLSLKITMLQGSSVEPDIVAAVREEAARHSKVMIFLDSNHTHDHVLAELKAYAPLISPDSYCVVFDTVIEDLPADMYPDRPWSRGNNARTAVLEYLRMIGDEKCPALDGAQLRLVVDEEMEKKLAITVAPGGYLQRVAAE